MSQAFRHKAALAKLPEGAERPLIEQFRAIQNDLDAVRGRRVSVTPILSVTRYAPRIGELVLLSPPATGTLIALPQGSSDNVASSIRIAVVGGVLSPGVTVAIVGRKGTINGQQTLNLNSHRLVELVSCGAPGWFCSV